MNLQRSYDGAGLRLYFASPESNQNRLILGERAFHRMISIERKRTERSRSPFLLMLLDLGHQMPFEIREEILKTILHNLSSSTRDTDVAGWYRENLIAGLMFTAMDAGDKNSIQRTMLFRISAALQNQLGFEQFDKVSISFHWFPEEWGNELPSRLSNPALYPDLEDGRHYKTAFGVTKRIMDIVGSAMAIIFLAPLFFLIAVVIRIGSKGPAIFRQERLGQFGKTFTCLKFRTMYANNDVAVHKEFMKLVIQGKYEGRREGKGAPVYKMTNDLRVTRIGRILRRTSLDELPQFINVLKGEMSLVGPRPPLGYEYQQYDIWHRRRVLEVKPGITGLWQVRGRSRLRFDDMVRLDLRYVHSRSLLLDIQILLRTPRAVLLGHDAF